MSSDIRLVFFSSMVAFMILFFWMWNLDRRVSRIVRERARMSGALGYVAAVNIVIWAGIFGYLVYLDRKVRAAYGPGQEKPR